MELSIFLAKVFGLYLLIVSIAMFAARDKFEAMIEAYKRESAVMTLAMIITLIIGLLLISSHNIWVMGWPVVITLLAWLIFIKGVTGLFFPDKMLHLVQTMESRRVYLSVDGINFLLALFLLCKGYYSG